MESFLNFHPGPQVFLFVSSIAFSERLTQTTMCLVVGGQILFLANFETICWEHKHYFQ